MHPPPGLPPPPANLSSDALNLTLTQLDGTLVKLAQETELSRTAKEQASSSSARALTKFGQLPKWTQSMILLPNGGTMDANGDLVTDQTQTIKTYTHILQVTTVGSCKQYLDHLLNDVIQCTTNIPMLTCGAIHSGSLRWSNPDSPQAFSLFACPYSSGALPNSARLDQ
jgi:hypothetical protein